MYNVQVYSVTTYLLICDLVGARPPYTNNRVDEILLETKVSSGKVEPTHYSRRGRGQEKR